MSPRHRFADRATVTGSIPSKKSTQHMVHYRGLLQRSYIYLLEYDKDVLSYQERPFAIAYQREKQTAHYTPHFRVVWKDQRPRLVSCFSEKSEIRPSTFAQWTAAHLWCDRHDHDFALVTEETLRPHHTLLSNLELLAVDTMPDIVYRSAGNRETRKQG